MTVSSDLHRSSKSSIDALLLHKTDWRSIYFITSVAMMDSMRISTVLSNSWPYISSLDPEITENFNGLGVSVYTLGAALASLLAGWISNKLSHTRPPIMAGQIIAIVSTLLYANLELIPYNRRYGFFVCQILLGISNGAIQTWRVHVAMSSTDHDRSKANSIIGFSLNIGFILGPLTVMLFTRLLSTSIRLPWGVQLSIYTAPMYFMAFMSIIGLILIIIGFDGKMDKPHKPHGDEDNGVSNNCDQKWAIKSKVQLGTSPIDAEKAHLEIVPSSDDTPKVERPKSFQFDWVAILACIVARLCICFLILYLTALAVPYSMTTFGWSGEQMVAFYAEILIFILIFYFEILILILVFILVFILILF
uniref:Uncharacterized protein n=1 Tax=Meloidogyne enterolobii TaxID=390850 RepID=A0A6V7VCB6_MELEN|nr:unnamed protein product [Meloidogyne enterolobii]